MDDFRQTPIGFYNLGLAYLEAADALAEKELSKDDRFSLAFDHPIRHLYAHAWELFQKACLAAQGMKPSKMRNRFGHSLAKAWDAIDKERFEILDLHPGTRLFAENLDGFHPTKKYAYPEVGYRQDYTLSYLRAAFERFKINRAEILRLFPTAML